MKDDRALDHEDFDKEPERRNPFWFIVTGCLILLATFGALFSSMRMIGFIYADRQRPYRNFNINALPLAPLFWGVDHPFLTSVISYKANYES